MASKYFLYARKSQERDDRQVVSLEDQVREMKLRASKQGLRIVQVFQEAKSAKRRGRPIFNEMVRRIKEGEADGILCWKLNRLARNTFDGGEITGLLEEGVIREIQTSQRSYHPTDNVITIMVEFGMATQYSKDLSHDVKRGLREKAIERKWYPIAQLPLGYLHYTDPKTQQKSIIIDKEPFYIIKELWSLFLSGAYSIAEIKIEAELCGLVNKKNQPLSCKAIRRVFSQPFYAGYFFWKNDEGKTVRVDGAHKYMITEGEFLRTQRLLFDSGRNTRPRTMSFPYKGIIRCGECNGNVTAERKHRARCTVCNTKFSILHKKECRNCGTHLDDMDNPVILDQTYYHCTKKVHRNCSQKAITKDDIEALILKELEKINLEQDIYLWLKNRVAHRVDVPIEQTNILLTSLKNKRARLQAKIKKLVDLRLSGEISADQMKLSSEEYEKELKDTKELILKKELLLKKWEKEAYDDLEFANGCLERFKNATDFDKNAILMQIGSNPIILNKTLYLSKEKTPSAIFSHQFVSFVNTMVRTHNFVIT